MKHYINKTYKNRLLTFEEKKVPKEFKKVRYQAKEYKPIKGVINFAKNY